VALALAVAALAILSVWGAPVGAGAAEGGELVAQPAQGAPAQTMLGASPEEAPGEVWATSTRGRGLARYTDAAGWEELPAPGAGLAFVGGASAGRTTPRGGFAVAASDEEGEVLVVRDPGGEARQAADPGALLGGESLFGSSSAGRLLTASEGPGGRTEALVVPEGQEEVLDFDGEGWSSEEICTDALAAPGCEAPESPFDAIAIEAGGGEAWLLGREAVAGEGIELFRRETGGGATVWRQQPLGPPGSLGALFAEAKPLGVPVTARDKGQPLTVTEKGVWADAVLGEGAEAHDATVFYDIGQDKVTGSWCDLTSPAGLCQFPLGSELSAGQGRSFAWPSGGPYGRRVVTGVGQGAILSLEGSAFTRLALAGGNAGASEGAALGAPDEGWLGASPPLHLTRNPEPARLQSWPVPFRRPLLAIAPEPGAPVGALGSEALAVGDDGQVARYVPGQGWEPESLLKSSGKRATPTLRGVAWPEAGRAFAVGDEAAMWVWQKATGLWEPDPAKPRSLTRANFTGIAFDPSNPSRGYAVGKQGVLLGYGRTWTQEELPAGVPAEANFTSIAFAGSEALATYKYPVPVPNKEPVYTGGVLVDDGSGWQVDEGAGAALHGAVPQRVAGLPDGGAVVVTIGLEAGSGGNGTAIERQGPGALWQQVSGGSPGYPVALAAVREGGQVRAVVSVPPTAGQAGEDLNTDREQVFNQPPPGQAPLLTDPYRLPGGGVVIRQTANGWRDEQHQTYPLPPRVEGQTTYDLPQRPDPVLALLIGPEGEGWAVGGETGTAVAFLGESSQTAGVMRYGSNAAPPSNAAPAPIPTEAGTASFALGGDAQCAAACADLAGVGIGPDRWLRAAVGGAAQIGGLHAFLYAGPGVAGEAGSLGASLDPLAFSREEAFYAHRLGSAAGSLPVFAAPAGSDLDRTGSLSTFATAFSGFGAPLGAAPPGPGIAPVTQMDASHGYYSFDSGGAGGTVRVIVLDYAAPTLGAEQSCWLAGQLSAARQAARPAVVVGGRDLAGQAPEAATDAAQVAPILTGASAPEGCAPEGPAAASAYLFDFPEANRAYRLTAGGRSIPAYGSGTLGYVTPPAPSRRDFDGASGFLLVSVDVKDRDASTNLAPVSARLIPNIGALALDATDGTLLRRSQPALFEALARRPLAGTRCQGGQAPRPCEVLSPEPYVQIPSECQGALCSTSLFPEYTFTSSAPDIADFVAPDPRSANPRDVLLVNEKPVLNSHSGLLCAFNAGTTTVTVSTGGLSYSQKVTVLGGSVQRPCGTTPLRSRAAVEPGVGSPPAPAPAPAGSPAPSPSPALPPPPPPPIVSGAAPAPAPSPPAPPPAVVAPFVPLQAPAVPIVPIVPPPPAPAAQPTPPSGTSQVNALEREEEEEEAYDLVSQMSARPSPGPSQVPLTAAESPGGGHGGVAWLMPALLLTAAVAAAAGIGGRRRPRPQPAYQTTNRTRRYR
jgi:hypothetical protein